jgi:hypothetical protein
MIIIKMDFLFPKLIIQNFFLNQNLSNYYEKQILILVCVVFYFIYTFMNTISYYLLYLAYFSSFKLKNIVFQ